MFYTGKSLTVDNIRRRNKNFANRPAIVSSNAKAAK